MGNEASNTSYYEYWGKANNSEKPYHRLVYHSLDVAAVAFHLFDQKTHLHQDLSNFLQISTPLLKKLFVFSMAVHDLGKFSSAFQALNTFSDSTIIQPNAKMLYDAKAYRHDTLGIYFWEILTKKNLLPIKTTALFNQKHFFKSINVFLQCAWGHHGKPIRGDTKRTKMKKYTEPHNETSAISFIQAMWELFVTEIRDDEIQRLCDSNWREQLQQVTWHLAGMAVLSDWIGSDTNFFEYKTQIIPLEKYWEDQALEIAKNALDNTDIAKPVQALPFKSFKDSFEFDPTPLQEWAATVEIDNSPQLFILEDVTGSGKTEASLALTHRLLAAGAAEGFYFGLPTMATSNTMFDRVAEHYLKMLAFTDIQDPNSKPSIVLANSVSKMHESFREVTFIKPPADRDYQKEDNTASAQCNEWLADSRKKALLAPVGVGTIDQALLAVLPRKHQSMRLLGLHRKVLIFDEVHAADQYMLALLEDLLKLHLRQGGSAILLTATLSQQQRANLCSAWQPDKDLKMESPIERAFPLATKVTLNNLKPHETPIESHSKKTRTVQVQELNSFEACVDKVLTTHELGQCLVWVRNSVDDAIAAYQALREKLDNPDDCLLFHSRFVLQDRKSIEKEVIKNFGKSSKKKERAGKILIATQVFQESLDCDCDVMISDICPIDDLIQRTGRLHRHIRNASGEVIAPSNEEHRSAPTLFLHCPTWQDNPDVDWLQKDFRNTQYVYGSPGRLWLGLRQLRKLGHQFSMPQDARCLIEAVYNPNVLELIPEKLKKLEKETQGKEHVKTSTGQIQLIDWRDGYHANSHKNWYDDESEISTRFSEREIQEVLLLKTTQQGTLTFWNENSEHAILLSTVKLAKNSMADKLTEIPHQWQEALTALQQTYPRIKYMQCWLPELEPNFSYNQTIGFHINEAQQ
ncbi:MAG: CRISPR-associated helicase Cas3' [Pseudomonadota bacterium]